MKQPKDISDVLKESSGKVPVKKMVEELVEKQKAAPPTLANPRSMVSEPDIDTILANCEATADKVRQLMKTKIKFSPPLLTLNEESFIYRNTITLIQGQSGVHKSRISSHIGSKLIQKEEKNIDLMGIQTDGKNDVVICYIDTERNHKEQFPYAMQTIQRDAGYDITENLERLQFLPFSLPSRSLAHPVLEKYLTKMREKFPDNHLVVILDITTDFVSDFNKSQDCLDFVGFLNHLINTYSVSFICVIHENPGTNQKARGHLGTELANKASVQMTIGFHSNDSSILILQSKKCRQAKRFQDTFLRYCEDEKKLVLASESEINTSQDNKSRKAPCGEVNDFLGELLAIGPLARAEVLDELKEEFEAGKNVLGQRLKKICDNPSYLIRKKDNSLWQLSSFKEGRKLMYHLVSFERNTPPTQGALELSTFQEPI